MRLDLAMAIAQNDLVKVNGACKYHRVGVRFPYLDPALVDFTGRLGVGYKVRGLQKRYLFKQAMRGILPVAILRKPKQGFGIQRSEEHTSELQSLMRISYAVFCLKKKT